jgi:hypothetical protein
MNYLDNDAANAVETNRRRQEREQLELTVTQAQADEAVKRLLATVTVKRAEQAAA